MPARLLTFLRDARWLNAERVRGYSLILLGVSAAGFLGWIALSHGLIDRAGKPLGTDFMSFYAAGKLALSGRAAEAWSPAAHHAAENAIFSRDLGYWAFFYPPAYLLVCAPLALAPYGAALLLWLGATAAAMLVLVRRWLRGGLGCDGLQSSHRIVQGHRQRLILWPEAAPLGGASKPGIARHRHACRQLVAQRVVRTECRDAAVTDQNQRVGFITTGARRVDDERIVDEGQGRPSQGGHGRCAGGQSMSPGVT